MAIVRGASMLVALWGRRAGRSNLGAAVQHGRRVALLGESFGEKGRVSKDPFPTEGARLGGGSGNGHD